MKRIQCISVNGTARIVYRTLRGVDAVVTLRVDGQQVRVLDHRRISDGRGWSEVRDPSTTPETNAAIAEFEDFLRGEVEP